MVGNALVPGQIPRIAHVLSRYNNESEFLRAMFFFSSHLHTEGRRNIL